LWSEDMEELTLRLELTLLSEDMQTRGVGNRILHWDSITLVHVFCSVSSLIASQWARYTRDEYHSFGLYCLLFRLTQMTHQQGQKLIYLYNPKDQT
jgi:hypothetical protein